MIIRKADAIALLAIKEHIDQHFPERILIIDLINLSGLSKNKLYSGFKFLFGKTIIQYSITLRMEKAALLLRSQDMIVKEVAHEVGYGGRSHKFIPEFKKYYGMTPAQYKNKYQFSLVIQ